MTASTIAAVAKLLAQSKNIVALTGAGVSTESGIPDFRSGKGLWDEHDPMDVASIEGYEEDTARFFRFWAGKFSAIAHAKPGPAHRFLAGLEKDRHLKAVITQNIDGLHQKAGSKVVYEAHGSFRRVQCLSCGEFEGIASVFARVRADGARAPACQKCGGRRLKPGVVLFGEMLPKAFADAEWAAKNSEVLLAMGSSLQVHPVAGLVEKAQQRGAIVVIINRDSTAYDDDADLVLRGEFRALTDSLQAALSQRFS